MTGPQTKEGPDSRGQKRGSKADKNESDVITFGSHGLHLHDAGYDPIPVRGKQPYLDGWNKPLEEAQIRELAANGAAGDSIGLLLGGDFDDGSTLRALDVDIRDADVAAAVAEALQQRVPAMREWMRVGYAPKFAVLVRMPGDPHKVVPSEWLDAEHVKHKIEVLGLGQQVVVYGRHPEVQQPYFWWTGSGPIAHDAYDAPLIDQTALDAAVVAFDAAATAKGWTRATSADSATAPPPADVAAKQTADRSLWLEHREWIAAALAAIPPASMADRANWLKVLAGLHFGSGGDPAAWDMALEYSRQWPGYTDDADVEKLWESLAKKPHKNPASFGTLFHFAKQGGWVRPNVDLIPARHLCTDQANARRIAKAFGNDIFYLGGEWFGWSGTHWHRRPAAAVDKILKVSDLILEEKQAWETKPVSSEDERKKNQEIAAALDKWSKQSEMEPRQAAAIRIVKQVLTRDASEIDADPWLLNCRNGTVDLRTGELREHRRDDFITKLIDVDYDPDAKAPRFELFLEEIFLGNVPLIRFIKRWCGYCATGDVREESFAVWWGDGGNGKTKLVRAIESVLGPYAITAAPHLLIGDSEKRHETELADLRGARLATTEETAEGGSLAENTVKRITGGNRIKARRVYKDHIEFDPTHKIQLLTNHKPTIKGTDTGIWRRVKLIPFEVIFGTAEEIAKGLAHRLKDTQLGAKLLAERAGILAWIVQGAVEWYAEGLNPPDTVHQATGAYRTEMDRVGQFVVEQCERVTGAWVPLLGNGGLYPAYSEWCRENGYHTLGRNRFQGQIKCAVPTGQWRNGDVPAASKYTRGRRNVAGFEGLRLRGG